RSHAVDREGAVERRPRQVDGRRQTPRRAGRRRDGSRACDRREPPARTRQAVPVPRRLEEPAVRLRPRRAVIRPGVVMVCAALIGGCAARPAKPAGPPPVPLHLEPACDIAPAAGLSWLVELEPRAIAMTADL